MRLMVFEMNSVLECPEAAPNRSRAKPCRADDAFPSRWFTLITLIGIVAFGLFQSITLRTNSDVAWYLYAGARVLDGAQLGEDIVEVNVPMVIAFSTGVEALARGIESSAIAVFPWVVVSLALVSLAACAALTRDCERSVRRALILVLAFVLLIHVGGVFGQREHLLLIFVLPYVLSVARLAGGQSIRSPIAITIGVVASFGFALKPYFLPAWLALEAYLVFRRGFRVLARPQALAMYAALGVYVFGTLIWTPDYFEFAAESFPIYRAYQPYGDMPLLLSLSFGFVLAAILISVVTRFASFAPLIDVLCVFCGALAFGVFAQGKGWYYQWYPAVAIGIVALSITGVAWTVGTGPIAKMCLQLLGVAAIAVICARTYLFWSGTAPEQLELREIVSQQARGEPILALSSHLPVGFPLVNETELRWASRFPTFWQLAAFFEPDSASGSHYLQAERNFLDAAYTDFTFARPGLLIVDSRPPAPHLAGFDYLEYFKRDDRLREILAEYRPVHRTERFLILRRCDLE
jgi:hypothetical protein